MEVTPIKRTISAMSGKGVVEHNRRTYIAENVDPARTHLNIEYCYTPIEQVYHEMFDEALAAYNARQKRKDRRIENYYEKIRESKQEKPFYEVIFQIGNMKDMGIGTENGDLAAELLNKFMLSFQERNPSLHVFSAHLHLDEKTPHLHIDFVPFTTGSKRGLSTRVSLKQALADQGIVGEGRSLNERDLWIQREKEALAEIMLERGIEWEQKGEHREHLSVLEYKREQRTQELAELEQKVDQQQEVLQAAEQKTEKQEKAIAVMDKKIEHIQQQKLAIECVEKIEPKSVPLSSKVILERSEYESLSTAAKKYVTQEKKEKRLQKLLDAANQLISELKNKITALTAELSEYKSVRGKMRTGNLEQENKDLRRKIDNYETVIERQNLWHLFGRKRSKVATREEVR